MLANAKKLAFLVALTVFPITATAQTGEKETRADDREALQARLKSFIKAFESGDAQAVANHWTEEGEYIAADTTIIRGRDAIEKAYSQLFGESKGFEVEVEMESLRFIGQNTALEEGYMKVFKGKDQEPSESKYSVLHVRENGQWLMAVVREWPRDEYSLRDLQWLVGEWKAQREGIEVHTSYKWIQEKSFLKAQFSIKDKDRTHSGFQIIGKDPSTGYLRSWTFEQDGGLGEARWVRDEKKWVLDAAGITSDGSILTATNILVRIDNDSFTWQSINRTLDGEELPDIAPIRVTRVTKK